jgi:hypothetical protein
MCQGTRTEDNAHQEVAVGDGGLGFSSDCRIRNGAPTESCRRNRLNRASGGAAHKERGLSAPRGLLGEG